jgi:hypothetical protein
MGGEVVTGPRTSTVKRQIHRTEQADPDALSPGARRRLEAQDAPPRATEDEAAEAEAEGLRPGTPAFARWQAERDPENVALAERIDKAEAQAEARGLELRGDRPHDARSDLPRSGSGFTLTESGWVLAVRFGSEGHSMPLAPTLTLAQVESFLAETEPPTLNVALAAHEAALRAERGPVIEDAPERQAPAELRSQAREPMPDEIRVALLRRGVKTDRYGTPLHELPRSLPRI